MKPTVLGMFAFFVSASAVAQPAAGSGRPDPLDANAAVAPLSYQSPFARYRVFADGSIGPWRDVNDEVARIGGWKAYAREVYEASEAARGAAATSPARPGPVTPPGAGPKER